MTLPNFIVIGAAKAGTTALASYLAEHPAVFVSPIKETNYFAYGLDAAGRLVYGNPDIHHFPVKSLEEYERQFAGAGEALAAGEASPIYLECPQAAGRIRDLLPGARIICGLRHPVDRAYSDYQMFLRNRGRRLDASRDFLATADWAHPDSHWMRIGRYHEALSRYFDAFPRSQIHIFLFDDLKRNTLRVVQEIYDFIGVDRTFVPDLATPHNVGGMPSSIMLEKVFRSGTLRSLVSSWIPKRVENAVRRLRTRTMRQAPPLPAELRRELTIPFREDILRTSRLVDRGLEHWL